MTEVKQGMKTAPQEERETIISYDRQTETWHIYTDEPKHARKYEKYVTKPQRKGYNLAGQLIMLEGDIDKGTVSISKKVRLTEKQKEKQRQVLQKARISHRVNLQTEKININ
ncbi:hypothetical protein EGO58_00350 [Limosilactobacillus reuteri]|uniref:Uncharacterized protein n=1 Tax=Limosilactobacillus reuteri TaxID=1598 RepID=A0A143Q0K8_LIMRT|nr:hypothetical protein [Limosilactobacillus reuteri]AMY14535.1 hypothetical protein ADV92_08385 [Limosilactobacillus reuteri]MDZ5438391.1 hypothetical protein [Limosilactobacillus reuteri]PWT32516.1 hypothetical protein DKZ21_06890 [Limosilactobacillus reuteri]PWT35001.1 hypothetical protein DKZ24_06050 [Limosilactobacillus reuteri]PWT41396.1 hypothetical protein DKZ22_06635 [Limosilactobacillus reuteri]